MNFLAHFSNDKGEHRSYLYAKQACYGSLAQSMLGYQMKEGWHLSAVEYIVYKEDSVEHLIKLADMLKVKGAEVRKVGDVADLENPAAFPPKDRSTLYIPVADLPINLAMYQLFAIRNADRYLWGENRHPMLFQMFQDGRLSLIEAVAFANLVKENVPMNNPKVSSFQLHHMYNSLLIQDHTTVADFRRFLKDPSDCRGGEKLQTFKEFKKGYPRFEGDYICTNFQAKTRHHKTRLLKDYIFKVIQGRKRNDSYLQITVEQFCELGNYLLKRKVFDPKEEFRRKK